jgi:hypothetical protein
MRGVEYFVQEEGLLFVIVSPHIRNWSFAAYQQKRNLDAPHIGGQ